MFLGHNIQFWIAIAAATLFKVMTSERISAWKVIGIIIGSVLVAWVFTDAVMDYLQLDPQVYETPVAALLALSGENIARWISKLVPDDAIKIWRQK